MFKILSAALIFLISITAIAQDKVPASVEEYQAQRSGGRQKWSRSVDWYNLDQPIDFHSAKHSNLRLIHFLEPANPACLSIARQLEEEFKFNKVIQVIHVVCPPRGLVADSSYVTQILMQHELRAPVAVFTDVDPVAHLEITQFPAIRLTHLGGLILFSYDGQVGVEDGIQEIAGYAAKDKLGKIPVFAPEPKNVLVNNAPRKLIASPTYMIGVDRESRLYVSDTQRNRVLLVDSDGQINERIGNGKKGFSDGTIHNARFNGPSGLAFDKRNGVLYVADTYNHAVRAVEMRSREVTTILGTGSPAAMAPDEVYGTTAAISCPTDLELRDGKLYIAMTGFNQVWEMDLLTQKAKPIAGSGRRGSDDGEAEESSFSGPSALTFDKDGNVIVLDRYSGNVRSIGSDGLVRTVFNNVENDSSEVKLKSPTDIIRRGGEYLIADPLSHQIFSMTPNGKLSVYNGTGEFGFEDGKAKVATHGAVTGLADFEGALFASDAFYGIIRTIEGKKPKMDTFEFTSVDGLLAFEGAISEGEAWYFDETKMAEGTNTLNFSVKFHENYEMRIDARNEIALADGKAATRKMREDGWHGGKAVFEVDNTLSNRYIQFELYMTFSPVEKPEIIYYASVGVIIPFHEEYISKSTHNLELDFFSQFDRSSLP